MDAMDAGQFSQLRAILIAQTNALETIAAALNALALKQGTHGVSKWTDTAQHVKAGKEIGDKL